MPEPELCICQVCGAFNARVRSDPNGCDPDLLCDQCVSKGSRRSDW